MDFDNPALLPGILIPQQRVWIPQTGYKFEDEAVIALSATVRLVDALNGHCKNPIDPPILGLDMTGVVFKLRVRLSLFCPRRKIHLLIDRLSVAWLL